MEFAPWLQKKLVVPEKIEEIVQTIRNEKKTIATLNGSFDLLHAGHLYIIHQASMKADVLFVLLNSDQSIRAYKSLKRPIIELKYRLQMVAALEFVNYVTWFDEIDPRKILEKIRPDVHVNGAEYGESCIEAETVKNMGAVLHLVDRIEGLATTSVIERVKQCV